MASRTRQHPPLLQTSRNPYFSCVRLIVPRTTKRQQRLFDQFSCESPTISMCLSAASLQGIPLPETETSPQERITPFEMRRPRSPPQPPELFNAAASSKILSLSTPLSCDVLHLLLLGVSPSRRRITKKCCWFGDLVALLGAGRPPAPPRRGSVVDSKRRWFGFLARIFREQWACVVSC